MFLPTMTIASKCLAVNSEGMLGGYVYTESKCNIVISFFYPGEAYKYSDPADRSNEQRIPQSAAGGPIRDAANGESGLGLYPPFPVLTLPSAPPFPYRGLGLHPTTFCPQPLSKL